MRNKSTFAIPAKALCFLFWPRGQHGGAIQDKPVGIVSLLK